MPLFPRTTSWIAPRHCLACSCSLPPLPPPATHPLSPHLCHTCLERLEPLTTPCTTCAAPRGPHAKPTRRCPACRRTPRGHLRSTTAALRYRGPTRALLHRLKYRHAHPLAKPLAALTAHALRTHSPHLLDLPDLTLVPIPLHPLRALQRGYNQAHLLALELAHLLDLPLAHPLLRLRRTPPLHRVPHDQRPLLLQRAFSLHPLRRPSARTLLLVDDIRTTGATLRAAAHTLQPLQPRAVHALVVAR